MQSPICGRAVLDLAILYCSRLPCRSSLRALAVVASVSSLMVYANPAWCGMFECPDPSQLLRRPLKDLIAVDAHVVRRHPPEHRTGQAAHSSHPVLILGESGTGEEMVARSIHFPGPFRDKPFIPVDCGSPVPTLIESELFGYVKGACTRVGTTDTWLELNPRSRLPR